MAKLSKVPPCRCLCIALLFKRGGKAVSDWYQFWQIMSFVVSLLEMKTWYQAIPYSNADKYWNLSLLVSFTCQEYKNHFFISLSHHFAGSAYWSDLIWSDLLFIESLINVLHGVITSCLRWIVFSNKQLVQSFLREQTSQLSSLCFHLKHSATANSVSDI